MMSLISLPTEILIEIIEDPFLPIDTLYGLALLCRRLHFIALPLYLTREGAKLDSDTVVIRLRRNGWDVLRALQIALFPVKIGSAIFCFPPSNVLTDTTGLLPHLRRVQRLISRLPPLERVTLQLDNNPKGAYLSFGGDRDLESWASHFQDLLNCIVARGCHSLSVLYGRHLTNSYQLVPGPTVTTSSAWNLFRSRFQDFLSSMLHLENNNKTTDRTQYFERNPNCGRSIIEMCFPTTLPWHRSPALKSLEIHSPILVLPSGLSWTLAALKRCPIESLCFHHSVIDLSIWHIVLPLITPLVAQKLTKLELYEIDCVSPKDMFTFIAHVPLLVHLTLSTHKIVDGPRDEASAIRLPQLETLHAPPSLLRSLLFDHSGRSRSPSSFPSLRSICAIWPNEFFNTSSIRATELLYSTFRTLSTRDERVDTPVPATEVELSLSTDMLAFSASDAHYNFPSPSALLPGDGPGFLSHLVALDIRAPFPFFMDFARIAAWIGRCPRMRRVNISFSHVPRPVAFMARFVREVRATEHLKQLTANGDVYELASFG